jgi:hypothetical protein
MRVPVLLTFTIDRQQFENPEIAYETAMPALSRVLSERLDIVVWARVIELQKETGEGWVHWHVLAELSGTPYARDLDRLRLRAAEAWGLGSVDVDRVRSREGVAAYICKEFIQGWPAIPPWILRRKTMRLLGFSKKANEILREAGLAPRRSSRRVTGCRRKRAITPLIDRLPASGLACRVMSEGRYLGTINAPLSDLIEVAGAGFGIELDWEEHAGTSRMVVRFSGDERDLDRLNTHLVKQGVFERAREAYRRRRHAIENEWAARSAARFTDVGDAAA